MSEQLIVQTPGGGVAEAELIALSQKGDAVAKLPPAQKKIFILKHLEGMKIREVALAVGCREGTVKAHLFKALRNLRKNLQ